MYMSTQTVNTFIQFSYFFQLGVLQRCPTSYYFCHRRLKCISGFDLQTKPEDPVVLTPGFPVSKASPMFILPDCISSGMFEYPDYRFYFVCESLPSSPLVITPKLYQCPVGLFYNSIYRTCTKASSFLGRDVSYFSFTGLEFFCIYVACTFIW